MDYSYLQNFSSLLEVFTAIYVSMFIDEILVNIWTPDYKDKIGHLIEKMKLPAINFFVKKVKDGIDDNAKRIRGHMKRKAAFFFVLCISLLLLAGLESGSKTLPPNEYFIVAILSAIGGLFFIFGRWMFSSLRMVAVSVLIYTGVFVILYFSDFAGQWADASFFKFVNVRIATASFLTAVAVPIIWQLFLIWIYARPYKGFMREKVSKEAYIYGKAYIAYKIKDMAALPLEYEAVARDFVSTPAEEDTSFSSLNTILVRRLSVLCEPPLPMKVFWSWIKFNFRGRHNREAEYLERNGLDYDDIYDNRPVASIVMSEEDNQDLPEGQGIKCSRKRALYPFFITGALGVIIGFIASKVKWSDK